MDEIAITADDRDVQLAVELYKVLDARTRGHPVCAAVSLDNKWIMMNNLSEQGVMDIVLMIDHEKLYEYVISYMRAGIALLPVSLRPCWAKVSIPKTLREIESEVCAATNLMLKRWTDPKATSVAGSVGMSLNCRAFEVVTDKSLLNQLDVLYMRAGEGGGIYAIQTTRGIYVRCHNELLKSDARLTVVERMLTLCALCNIDMNSMKEVCHRASDRFVQACKSAR